MTEHSISQVLTPSSLRGKHNVGVIGTGFIGEVHIRAIRASGNFVQAVSAATLEEARVAATKSNIPNA
jgi:predicted dehydrogenase